MTHHLLFDIDGAEPEFGAPESGRVLAGEPRFTTWNLEDVEGVLYAGIWEATPGKWRIVYDEWEYFSVLAGHSIVTEENGAPVHLRAGDRMIIRPGFRGTWEVVETTRKDYVIRL